MYPEPRIYVPQHLSPEPSSAQQLIHRYPSAAAATRPPPASNARAHPPTRAQAALCCRDARAVLQCDPNPAMPCRGFSGECADLPVQFAELPAMDGYVCEAFPTDSANDTMLVAAIQLAVAAPLKWALEQGFGAANAQADGEEVPQQWLAWGGKLKLGLGRMGWHWRASSAGRLRPSAAAKALARQRPWRVLRVGLAAAARWALALWRARVSTKGVRKTSVRSSTVSGVQFMHVGRSTVVLRCC